MDTNLLVGPSFLSYVAIIKIQGGRDGEHSNRKGGVSQKRGTGNLSKSEMRKSIQVMCTLREIRAGEGRKERKCVQRKPAEPGKKESKTP